MAGGLLSLLLGADSPAAKWAAETQGIRGAFGAGLGQGTDLGSGLASGLSYLPQGLALDRDAEKDREAKAMADAENAAKMEWVKAAYPQYAVLPPDVAVALATRAEEQKIAQMGGGGLEPTAGMRDFMFAQENPEYAEFLNPPKQEAQPASVQEYQFAVSQGYTKDYPTFVQEMKARTGGTPNATVMKEIFEADEGAQAGENVLQALDKALELNDTAWDGPLADVGSAGAALFGNQEAVQTQELKNIVTANALESLKATFGAAPTEGERKILLEVQGSVNQSREVREAIFKRARAAAERRLAFNKERADALRTGGYFEEGYSPVAPGPSGNQTSTGVTWSIEP